MIVILVWLASAHLGAEPFVAKTAAGPVAIQVKIDRVTVSLAERVTVRVTATGPPDVEVLDPKFAGDLDGVELAGMDRFGPDPTGEFVSRAWTIELEPLRAGRLSLPSLSIRATLPDGAAAASEITLEPIEVTNERAVEGSASELKEMPVPTDARGRNYLPSALRWSGLMLLVATGFYLVSQVLRRRGDPDAVESARVELKRIEEDAASEGIATRTAAQRSCDVLRRYIERRYGVRTTLQTTEEFLNDPTNGLVLSSGARSRLSEILPLADEERFGTSGPSLSQWRELARSIHDFLDAEPRR